MKKYYFVVLLGVLFSCSSKPEKESITKLNGYWEIEKVEFPDGNKKEYQVNEFIDLIAIKNNSGIRQKVAPQLDGSFLKGNLQDVIRIVDSASVFYLKTNSKFTKWEERIISIEDESFVIENQAKVKYYYKKFIPYDKRN